MALKLLRSSALLPAHISLCLAAHVTSGMPHTRPTVPPLHTPQNSPVNSGSRGAAHALCHVMTADRLHVTSLPFSHDRDLQRPATSAVDMCMCVCIRVCAPICVYLCACKRLREACSTSLGSDSACTLRCCRTMQQHAACPFAFDMRDRAGLHHVAERHHVLLWRSLHSLHLLLMRLCSHMPEPPHWRQ